MFLAGVNSSLDEVKGHILGRKPLPSLREVFYEKRQKESQKRVILGPSPKIADDENSALPYMFRKWCDYGKKPWHTRDSYWTHHGKPPHIKKNAGQVLSTHA